jgi:hypothetical protein
MKSEYPEKDQRIAVCNSQFGVNMNTLDAEIFASGRWNGMEFEAEDLNLIASAFSALKEVHKVPLKFGHNDEQPITDGQPALGWVEDIWVKGNKLFAKFVDIPNEVYAAMQKKLYRHVSVELDMGVEHKGAYYTWVLSGVALLGADIPAVNTLADLTTYMSKDELAFKKRVAFTAINIEQANKESEMDELEKAKAEIARLKAENEAKDNSIQTFSKEKADADKELAEFKAKEAQRIEAETKAKFAKAKEDIITDLDELVKKQVITPAQREKFTAKYEEDDKAIEQLRATIDVLKDGAPKDFSKGDTGMESKPNDEGKAPDQIVLSRVRKLRLDHPDLDFSVARQRVMEADPELAREYANMNGNA